MKVIKIAIAAILLTSASLTVAHAGNKPSNPGASLGSPGHQMQGATTSTGHGASQYAPGDQMRDNGTSAPPGKSPEPGASGYAPGDAVSKGKK